MNKTSQKQKAKLFLSLHKQDKILVLPNIWDPLGARILQTEGFPAAATASAAISSSLGYQDEEKIKLSTHLEILRRIANAVDIPVSADIEGGYAVKPEELKSTIYQVLETGVAGINIEDSINNMGELRSSEDQAERLTAVREASIKAGVDLVINARIDFYLINGDKSKEEIIYEIIRRAKVYIKAGADCIFPVGITDIDILVRLRKEIKSPINVLCSPKSESLETLQKIGMNRTSFGPFIFRSCMKKFVRIITELKAMGSNQSFLADMLSKNDIYKYLIEDKEK
jgi:2-methylisocitrate lyase-like PEP mutase family enzyme